MAIIARLIRPVCQLVCAVLLMLVPPDSTVLGSQLRLVNFNCLFPVEVA